MKKLLVLVLCLVVVAFAFTSCAKDRTTSKVTSSSKEHIEKETSQTESSVETSSATSSKIEEKEPEPEPIPEDSYAIITSFGDTLVHESVFNSVYDYETDTYEFSPMFSEVQKAFEGSDVVIGNSESPFAGPDRGYSGYPCFNAPEHLATDLKELGVDILTTANNHCLDKGFSGLESTLNYMNQAGIEHVGTARSKEEQDKILFKDLNGIKTAFLAFTYGTNGIPVPQGKEFSVNLIDRDLMLSQVQKAKDQGAECIIVSMHWGEEYQTEQDFEQSDIAKTLFANDVNIILGCHPHVLQPMKMLTVKTDDITEKKGLVIFSQGNFFSGQSFENTRNTAIFRILIKKDGVTKKISVENCKYVPVYDYRDSNGKYLLLDLNKIIAEYETATGDWSKSMYNLALKEKERCEKLIGPEIIN